MTIKLNYMNYMLKSVFALIIITSLVACGKSAKDSKAEVTEMRTKLEKLKKEKGELDISIRALEADIAKADPASAQLVKKLVSAEPVRVQEFAHYIELQGTIDAENIAYVSPRGQGGVVKAVYVKPGSRVSKGQLVLRLDDAVAQQAVVAARQQIGGLKAQVAQAQSIYERQQNLWNQNIGTEVQVLNAKTNLEALQSQLKGAEANVRMAQEQAGLSNVYAEISGVVEQVNIRVGEFFSPQSAANERSPGILIVNSNNLKMVTNVPDNYTASVKKGDKVLVVVPESGKPPFESVISVVGASIDPNTRSFTVEAKVPSDPLLKPNQTATMKILDYSSKNAITVPINVVQSDEKGKYVYVIETAGDKSVARKKTVVVGEVYNGMVEVKSGLTGGEMIITDGYQTVYDGQSVTTGK
jgi:RND family efflux transporter MFP subunit